MASISKERLREMEEEMDRFEAEIQAPGQPQGSGFILGAKTFDRVQEQLTTLRREADEKGGNNHSSSRRRDRDTDSDNIFGDEDLRGSDRNRSRGGKRPNHDDEANEFFDVDERPGRAHGPRIAAPPPPPPPPPGVAPMEAKTSNLLAPPPPPPPPPDGMDNGGGGAPFHPQPAFMPPQLRHRMPLRPPPGQRPPFPRPPAMRMAGLQPPPPPPSGMPFARAPGPPAFMGPGPNMMVGPMRPMAPQMGMQQGSHPMGPQMGMQQASHLMGPPVGPQDMGGMMQPIGEGGDKSSDQQKVYSAAPVINVELKKDEQPPKKKKKKKKVKEEDASSTISSAPSIITHTPSPSQIVTAATHPQLTAEELKIVSEFEVNPVNPAMYGGGGMMPQQGMMGGMETGGVGQPGAAGGKKEKKKKEKKFIRMAANTTWEDPTLSEWSPDDFRIFAGDLGNEVTDDTLVRAFSKYPGFLKAKVVRDRRSNKTKGYGFISFKDPVDFAKAMREMNGKYVGNRPIKLRKSNWKDRNIEIVKKKDREKKRLGLK